MGTGPLRSYGQMRCTSGSFQCWHQGTLGKLGDARNHNAPKRESQPWLGELPGLGSLKGHSSSLLFTCNVGEARLWEQTPLSLRGQLGPLRPGSALGHLCACPFAPDHAAPPPAGDSLAPSWQPPGQWVLGGAPRGRLWGLCFLPSPSPQLRQVSGVGEGPGLGAAPDHGEGGRGLASCFRDAGYRVPMVPLLFCSCCCHHRSHLPAAASVMVHLREHMGEKYKTYSVKARQLKFFEENMNF
ncbi:hypothetical protein H8959_017969 [Pygathrix nigripes]